MNGLFGNLFDLNHDGTMDTFERTVEFSFLDKILGGKENDEDYERTEFELSGLDANELEFMDAEERREALEDAGLDPDDYDF